MNITIASVGKIKEKYLEDGIKEYAKRLSKYCKLNFIEVQDEKAPEKLSLQEENIIKNKEGAKLLSKIKENSYLIALAIDGEQLTSEKFSEKIDKIMLDGKSDITFVIGGSLGLSDEVLKKSDYKLSFSKMTFPHQLMKMILLEQVYRGFRISRGEPYHK
ncbi:ribosomal RNA large subunit methyltransferase H [Gottschalkia acidurici 9a]|uniref:Ribosomal RNA large subunit methyltransferase H n=1 Tax=Gottschalkia acidurici (strain ATCC 7906 / DSM 604 / BCRC 14475 / CIP 104303 / KCTC 5404 / NCIMB 10678 / 9a) TaxID=1128398 RepID=K0B1D9_GOTA9|nr:23S rRNA (pseudouridine(1915)-N(3))-methyltransferase RlmH [Gottschalkia acidurici]AFS79818.1 ribosomal RNA large subunit methyltransferase H [Gottschalkia acidurici 9a]